RPDAIIITKKILWFLGLTKLSADIYEVIDILFLFGGFFRYQIPLLPYSLIEYLSRLNSIQLERIASFFTGYTAREGGRKRPELLAFIILNHMPDVPNPLILGT